MEENVLTLTNTRTHAQESFQIEDELGRGGSRTAFRAMRRGKQDEPDLLVTLKRLDGDGALSESQYERFRHCCKTHVELTNNGLANFIPAIMDDYESKEGVRYAVTALVDGQTMDKKQFETLHEYLKVLCDLADVVAAFHKKGWLLLDIKPANILVKDGDRGVTLIDLDSLLHKDELGHDKPVLVGTSAGSGDPYLPDDVSTAADVYSLGAMLFQKILGRWPASLDRWPTARYDFEKAWGSGELTNQLCRYLTKLFRKTLTPPAMRWSMEELEAALRQLAVLTDPARLRLRVEKRSAQGLLGREDEYKSLLEMLHKPEKKPVFIWGKPGMGKSSLASEFAARHKNEFDFQIVPFAGTLRQTILNIATNDAATLQLQPDERYREIIKCLSDCDEKTVLIIDGFDADDGADTGALRRCEEFYELLRLPVRLVFTTKFHFPRENEYDSIPVGPLKEKDLLWLMRDDDREIRDRASLRKIMTLIEQNTLVANIAGCTIRYSYGRITAAGLLDRLRAGSCDDENEVESWHNNVLQYGNMLYHLRTLFRLANMNEAAKHVLSCMCLTGHSGISADLLRKNISKEWWNAAQHLSRSGWLQCDGENTFTMHDLPRMVCMNDETVKPTMQKLDNEPELCSFLRGASEWDAPLSSLPNFTEMRQKLEILDNALSYIRDDLDEDSIIIGELLYTIMVNEYRTGHMIAAMLTALELQQMLESSPEWDEAENAATTMQIYKEMGAVFASAGSKEEAVAFLDKALLYAERCEEEPGDVERFKLVVVIEKYEYLGQWNEAREKILELYKYEPADVVEAALRKIDILIQTADVPDIAEQIKKQTQALQQVSFERDPLNHIYAAEKLAVSYLSTGDAESAIDLLKPLCGKADATFPKGHAVRQILHRLLVKANMKHGQMPDREQADASDVFYSLIRSKVEAGALDYSDIVEAVEGLLDNDINDIVGAAYYTDLLEEIFRTAELDDSSRYELQVMILMFRIDICHAMNDPSEYRKVMELENISRDLRCTGLRPTVRAKLFHKLKAYFQGWLAESLRAGRIETGSEEHLSWITRVNTFSQEALQAEEEIDNT